MSERKKKPRIFRKLLRIFPKKIYFILGVISILILSIVTIIFSFLIKLLFDAAINLETELFYTTFYSVLGLMIFVLIFTYIRSKLIGIYAESGVKKLRQMIGEKLTIIPYDKLSQSHSGDYVSRATNDINKVKQFLSETITGLISLPITCIGAMTYLMIISWKLTLISLTIIPILFFGSLIFSKPMGVISKKVQEKLSNVNSIVQDVIKGIEVSKAYNLENDLSETYDANVDESVEEGKKLAKKTALLNSYSEVVGIIPFVITFFLGGLWAINGDLTPGELIAFITLLNFVVNPITQLPRFIGDAKVNLSGGERIIELLEYVEERKDGNEFALHDTNLIINLQNLTFAYPGKDELVLNKINFNIKKGESVALVGPSGCGKSTIMKLLLGYYNNYNGEIIIGEHKLSEWSLKNLRDKLAFVSQDTFLFPESIMENISYGNLNASKEEIINAAKYANAHEFIEGFADGYDTLVGELGNKLSGGQKQRLSIARAFLKKSEVLLLDEATSALDNESEALVQDALDKIIKDKTSLIIAHRLTTIKNVDRILVLSNGSIVEEGTHEELLNLGRLYSQLYNKQLKNKEVRLEGKVV